MIEKIRFDRKTVIWYLLLMSGITSGFLLWLLWKYLPLQIYEYNYKNINHSSQHGIYSCFCNIDNNDTAEEITIRKYNDKYYKLEILKNNKYLFRNIRLKADDIPENNTVIAGDYNNDSIKEVFCLTIFSDSLFLSGFSFDKENHILFVSVFLDKFRKYRNNHDIKINEFKIEDVNNDSFKELIIIAKEEHFSNSGKIYVYDIKNNVLISSNKIGNIPVNIHMADSDNDGKMEFFGSSNFIEGIVNKDDINPTFLFGLDDNLRNSIFTHIKDYQTNLLLLNDKSNLRLGVFLCDNSNANNQFLLKYDFLGNIIDSVKLTNRKYDKVYNFRENISDRIILINKSSGIDIYNTDFKLIKSIYSDLSALAVHCESTDNRDLFLFIKNNEDIVLYDKKFKTKILIPLSELGNQQISSYSIISIKNIIQLILYGKSRQIANYQLSKNILYHFRYLVYSTYFLISTIVLFVLFGVPFYFIISRTRLEKKMHKYHLQAIQNQLEPHFTFNILSSIGALIYSDNKEKAYSLLTQFADLLRTVLVQNKEDNWSLKKELDFVNIYTLLQNSRYNNKFNYYQFINITDTNSINVPKMIIQSYVGNAIKHGLESRKEGGIIKLFITKTAHYIIITIDDNGIGRKKSKEIQIKSTGQGIKIWSDFFKTYNLLHKVHFKFDIIDKYNKYRQPQGTKVIIKIPLNYNEI